MTRRCEWVSDDPLYIEYHDNEWGRPQRDDVALFEMLTLEGAQAGLSWITILRKREGYRKAFSGFDPRKVARFNAAKVERLMANEKIVRNRLKIESTIDNARAVLAIQKELGSLSGYLWSFVGGEPRINRWKTLSQVPAETDESRTMSKALRKRGFRFVGPTICYAFMQACGMVNDHTKRCDLYPG